MIIAFHETESGYVWWDEALRFAIPIIVAVALVLWMARRARSDGEDD